ncbi:hypothetical protein ABZ920_26145 [Streptomyces sp. NPDC046831]
MCPAPGNEEGAWGAIGAEKRLARGTVEGQRSEMRLMADLLKRRDAEAR